MQQGGIAVKGAFGGDLVQFPAPVIDVDEVAAGEFCWPPGQVIDDDRLEKVCRCLVLRATRGRCAGQAGDRRGGQLCV